MFILDVTPVSPGDVPVLMVQAGSNANGNVRNVVVQDLTPTL